MTNNLHRRLFEHRERLVPGFTSRYGIDRLVYCVVTADAAAAIAREKQVKGWVRRRKMRLIEEANPGWEDLSGDW